MKPTSSYKLPKSVKRSLANIIDNHKRGEIKRSMIQAQLFAAATRPKSKKEKDAE